MLKFINKLIGDKREWKAYKNRKESLTGDCKFVMNKIEKYLFLQAADDSIMQVFQGVLDLFLYAEKNGQSVKSIVGYDVAAFCDDIIKEQGKTWLDKYRKNLNEDIKVHLHFNIND